MGTHQTNLCYWLWSGIEWVENPDLPYTCTDNQTCSPPSTPGMYIDQEEITVCI